MAPKKKVVVKKKKEVLSKKGHDHSESQMEENLALARSIMEHKTKGFLVIAEITEEEDGFSMTGAGVVNDVKGKHIAEVILSILEMDAMPFVLAEFKLKKNPVFTYAPESK